MAITYPTLQSKRDAVAAQVSKSKVDFLLDQVNAIFSLKHRFMFFIRKREKVAGYTIDGAKKVKVPFHLELMSLKISDKHIFEVLAFDAEPYVGLPVIICICRWAVGVSTRKSSF